MSIEDYQARRAKDYQEAFGSAAGQRVLGDLATQFGIMTSTFDPNPFVMAKNEGLRGVVLYIQAILEFDGSRLREFAAEAKRARRIELERTAA